MNNLPHYPSPLMLASEETHNLMGRFIGTQNQWFNEVSFMAIFCISAATRASFVLSKDGQLSTNQLVLTTQV
jgi:hypothetical protein